MNTVDTTKKTAFVSIIAYNWVIHHQLDCAIAILSEKKRKVETIAGYVMESQKQYKIAVNLYE